VAEAEKQELLIIKRVRGGSHDHHGGAWKIAFADFMTAMMALFLVLWLINATNQKTKASLARYFNPVDLVDMSTMKRGVHDPNNGPENDGTADGASFPKSAPNAAKKKGMSSGQREGAAGPSDVKSDDNLDRHTAELPPTHSEEALFRDPYAVLAEIASSGASGQASSDETADQSSDNDSTASSSDTYADPFKVAAPAPASADSAASGQSTSAPPKTAAAVSKTQPVTKIASSQDIHQQTPDTAPAAPTSPAALADKLQQQIASLIGPATSAGREPAIEVKATDEGVLISLTDQANFAMFAIGSAEPQAKTVHIMDKIARILKKIPGDIVVGGFTDGRPYHSAVYDNWRLSSARAEMAYYMLVRGGVDQKRVVRIEGYADRQLKIPSKPFADENRRIEIFLKEKKA
jgi:chemotaxis protein MotB